MGRLKALAPRVAVLGGRLPKESDAEGHSASAEPWRAWYSLQRWRDLRMAVLIRDNFTCQCGCRRLEPDTSLLVADHRRPHRGDPALFWDPSNLQTLWKLHHDRDKQRMERRGRLAR